jgi:hypothetical protein
MRSNNLPSNQPLPDETDEIQPDNYENEYAEKKIRRIFDQLEIEMKPVKYRDDNWSKNNNVFSQLISLREVLK